MARRLGTSLLLAGVVLGLISAAPLRASDPAFAAEAFAQAYTALSAPACGGPNGFAVPTACCPTTPHCCDNAWRCYCEWKARWHSVWSRVGEPPCGECSLCRTPRCGPLGWTSYAAGPVYGAGMMPGPEGAPSGAQTPGMVPQPPAAPQPAPIPQPTPAPGRSAPQLETQPPSAPSAAPKGPGFDQPLEPASPESPQAASGAESVKSPAPAAPAAPSGADAKPASASSLLRRLLPWGGSTTSGD